MPSTLNFGCLEFQRRSSEIPFPKRVVYGDVMLAKLGRSYKSFFPSENAEIGTLKVADGHSH